MQSNNLIKKVDNIQFTRIYIKMSLSINNLRHHTILEGARSAIQSKPSRNHHVVMLWHLLKGSPCQMKVQRKRCHSKECHQQTEHYIQGESCRFQLIPQTNKLPVEKYIKVETIDTQNAVKPIKSFNGMAWRKSLSLHPDVRIERNMIIAISEEQKEKRDETAKTLNGPLCSKQGAPFSGLTLPRTVVDMVQVIVTKRPATSGHAFDVPVSHFVPSSTRLLWVVVKISSGVFPFLLRRRRNFLSQEFFMYCKDKPQHPK